MKLFEVLGFKDEPETGMATYDDMIRKPEYFERSKRRKHGIRMMSPEEYIQRAVQGFAKREGFTREQVLASRDPQLVNQYAEEMQQGAKFPTLVLDYSRGFDQEGLHRALAAKKLGIEEVPVMMVSLTKSKERQGRKAAY